MNYLYPLLPSSASNAKRRKKEKGIQKEAFRTNVHHDESKQPQLHAPPTIATSSPPPRSASKNVVADDDVADVVVDFFWFF
jgi:hypothetical protein